MSRRDAPAVVDRPNRSPPDLRAPYLHVLQPAMREIGRPWQENRINIAEEHLASAITENVMLRCVAGARCPETGGFPSPLAACVRGERHQPGLRMPSGPADEAGWRTTHPGWAVPVGGLVQVSRERRPAESVRRVGPSLPGRDAAEAANVLGEHLR